MRNPFKNPAKNHTPSYPWIVWVENVRGKMLMLAVYQPKRVWLFWRGLEVVHEDGPIYFKSDRELLEFTEELIDAGIEVIPPGAQYRVAMSLDDVVEILKDTWGMEVGEIGY